MKKYIAIILTISSLFSNISVFASDDELEYTPYINGYQDGTFRPDEYVTVAEAVSMVAKLSTESEKIGDPVNFADVSADSWYNDAVLDLSSKGFLANFKNKLNPDAAISRQQMASFAYQLKNGASNASFSDMFTKAIMDGIIVGDERGYRPEDNLTRAEAVAMLNRVLLEKFGEQDTSMLYKGAFSDVNEGHWAFDDILLASVAAHNLTSLPAKVPEDYNTKEFDKYNEAGHKWETIPMVTKEMKDRGLIGGEGTQRLCGFAISSDGQTLLVGTDVAGYWSSYNGGKTWEASFGGMYSRGIFDFCFDPVNEDRVLAFGGYPTQTVSSERSNATNGIYLSEDRGRTWRQVLVQKGANMKRDFRQQIAYDKTSYDEEKDRCMVAYWSRPWHLQNYPTTSQFFDESLINVFDGDKKGLWKTEDGGETWFLVNGEMSDGVVKVNPENGTVYVANFNGFHRSTDGGKTFKTVLGGSMIYGLDIIDAYPNRVYVNDYKSVLVSEDSGENFKRIESKNFPVSYDITNPDRIIKGLKVSPLNPKNMVIADFQGSSRYCSEKYFSTDGGVTWTLSVYDRSDDFIKANNRDTNFLWSPVDENKVFAFGGDHIATSYDAGKTYKWDYNGGAAICVTGRSAFNLFNPDLFYYGSQDFHGGYTKDGGETWKHVWKATGSQGAGFVYGAYAADENTLICLASTEKAIEGVGTDGGWDGVREIRVSRDGGNTFVKTGVYKLDNHAKKWSERCYQSPNNPDVLFAANFRSDDYGYTWEKMEDCDVVYTHNPYGKKELYGAKKDKVVVSYDDGATWEVVTKVLIPEKFTETPELTEIWDVAYDGVNNILYYVSGINSGGEYFAKYENGVTTDLTDRIVTTYYGKRFQLVEVDPRYPNVVYIGGCGGSYMEENGVQRSVDGAETFQVLSANGQDNTIVKEGPAHGFLVRDLLVHPITGELWVINSTRGWSKIAPPYEN